jgi:hypothetical protein
VDYTAGALAEADLDNDSLQAFYMAQEAIDIANIAMGRDTSDEWDAETILIHNVVDPVADQDAATKNYVDNAAIGVLGSPISIANGGTAAITAPAALISLGLTKGADVASATALVIGTDGDYFDVTGTTTVTSMTVTVGRTFYLQFDGAVTLTDGASLVLPGSANITTAAGDVFAFKAVAANTVVCIGATLASGKSVINITGDSNAWTNQQYFTPVTDDSSTAGAITFDFTAHGNYIEFTLTENLTAITLTGLNAGGTYKIRLKQHASAAKTITGWPAAVVWTGDDTDPVMNTTVGQYTTITIEAGTTSHMGSSQDYG